MENILEGPKRQDADSRVERTRLSPIPKAEELFPWVRAATLEGTFLYWMPVSGFPIGNDERAWLLSFLDRWTRKLSQHHGLRSELFLQFKTAGKQPSDEFRRYALTTQLLTGLTRRPGASLPTFPPAEELKKILASGEPFDLNDWIADLCYWFVSKKVEEHRTRFFGNGGMTAIFLQSDPKTTPPKLPFTPKFRASMPLFQQFDVDAIVEGTCSMQDAFLAKSKQMFGKGLENEVIYPGIAYVVPLLESGHFFAASAAERKIWFSLFDVYLNESPADKGIVMAFQNDFEKLLLETLKEMRQQGLEYPSVSGAAHERRLSENIR